MDGHQAPEGTTRQRRSILLTAAAIWLLAGAGLSHAAVTFTDTGATLLTASWGSPAWGDFDADLDLDLVLTHPGYTWEWLTMAFRNDGAGTGTFSAFTPGLAGVTYGSTAWGDYDNDGDLDLVLTGYSASGLVARIYRYDGGTTFTDINAGLPGVREGSAAWGDHDNDGDLDLVLTGRSGSGGIARVYRNDGNGVFTDVNAGLPGVSESAAAWGDYDNDGDLDLLLAGTVASGWIARIYRNDGNGTFADINAGLLGLGLTSAAWGDYDNDGDLDLALIGRYVEECGDGYWCKYGYSRIYRNDAGAFTDIHAGLLGAWDGSVAWGDYDNDGHLDLALTGMYYDHPLGRQYGAASRIYHNNGDGTFTDINAGLPHAYHSTMAWGDCDNDGDLDLLLTGVEEREYSWGPVMSAIYNNDGAPTNTRPDAPTNLTAELSGDLLTLSWDAATDDYTPTAGLSYNIRVGTTSKGGQICSPLAFHRTGFRRVVALGNAQQRTSWSIRVPPWPRVFYCGVQAIDGAWAGSAFTPEVVCRPASPCVVHPTAIEFGPSCISVEDVRVDSFLVGNAGTAAISGNISESCEYFWITRGEGPFTLQPGESFQVVVNFHPTVSGEYTCVIGTGCADCPEVVCHGTGQDATPIALSVEGRWTGRAVELTWTPPGEQPAAEFEVQRTEQETGVMTLLDRAAITQRGSSFLLQDDTVEPGRTYTYTLILRERALPAARAETVVQVPAIPSALLQSQPNPFAALTRIPFALATESRVRLEILDIQGRLVRALVDGVLRGGFHSREWDGRNDQGEVAPNGLYFYRLAIEGGPQRVGKAVLRR